MTGQKDRYSTTEKLWNLEDGQLTTPKHDELVLMWFSERYCLEKLSPFLYPIPPEHGKYKAPVILSEVPIGRGFIVGYWDLVITFTPDLVEDRRYNQHIFTIECKPEIRSFGQTLRQLNTYKHTKIMDSVDQSGFCTIFQLLFTPDLRFKEAFESQGIWVISP